MVLNVIERVGGVATATQPKTNQKNKQKKTIQKIDGLLS